MHFLLSSISLLLLVANCALQSEICSKPDLYFPGVLRERKHFYNDKEVYNVRCASGYRLADGHNGEFICTKGLWTGSFPPCVGVDCKEPPPYIENGRRIYILTSHLAFSFYDCEDQYTLTGNKSVQCVGGQWIGELPECKAKYCTVPDVQNGEIGRTQRVSRYRNREVFQKIIRGSQISHDEKLLLRCDEDYLPFEGEKCFENNQVEVSCNAGAWSKILQCKKTSCEEEPPLIKGGNAVIECRKHGFGIWYQCDEESDMKIEGNITCHFGDWIGITPRCLSSPCNTRDLDYQGLIKPSNYLIGSSDSFDIKCEEGFGLATSAKDIKCIGGRWNITQNPCRKAPVCSIGDLSDSLSDGVIPDMNAETEEFVPIGSTMQLTCEDNLIFDGDSTVKCKRNGKWQMGIFQCIRGCLLKLHPSSNLQIQPRKYSYRFGENIILSCPEGQELTSDVKRVMCLGEIGWSDMMPDCTEEIMD